MHGFLAISRRVVGDRVQRKDIVYGPGGEVKEKQWSSSFFQFTCCPPVT